MWKSKFLWKVYFQINNRILSENDRIHFANDRIFPVKILYFTFHDHILYHPIVNGHSKNTLFNQLDDKFKNYLFWKNHDYFIRTNTIFLDLAPYKKFPKNYRYSKSVPKYRKLSKYGKYQNLKKLPKYQNFGKSLVFLVVSIEALNLSSQLIPWTKCFRKSTSGDSRLWFWPFTDFRFYFDQEPNERKSVTLGLATCHDLPD